MSIQSNINQGISLLSLLASQSPMAEERRMVAQEEFTKRKHERQAEQFGKIVNSDEFVKPSDSAAEAEVKVDIANKGIEITRQLYEDEPDRLGYETLVEFTKHRNMRQQELEGFTNLEATQAQQKQQNATAMANIHKAIEWSRQQDWNEISRALDPSLGSELNTKYITKEVNK